MEQQQNKTHSFIFAMKLLLKSSELFGSKSSENQHLMNGLEDFQVFSSRNLHEYWTFRHACHLDNWLLWSLCTFLQIHIGQNNFWYFITRKNWIEKRKKMRKGSIITSVMPFCVWIPLWKHYHNSRLYLNCQREWKNNFRTPFVMESFFYSPIERV